MTKLKSLGKQGKIKETEEVKKEKTVKKTIEEMTEKELQTIIRDYPNYLNSELLKNASGLYEMKKKERLMAERREKGLI
ncbi:MAG: hypothetical protein WC917_00795 [Bacilli bacterium]|jgi:hypothetical protein